MNANDYTRVIAHAQGSHVLSWSTNDWAPCKLAQSCLVGSPLNIKGCPDFLGVPLIANKLSSTAVSPWKRRFSVRLSSKCSEKSWSVPERSFLTASLPTKYFVAESALITAG